MWNFITQLGLLTDSLTTEKECAEQSTSNNLNKDLESTASQDALSSINQPRVAHTRLRVAGKVRAAVSK